MVELDGEAQVLRHLSGEAADDGKYEYGPEGDNRGEYVQEEPEQEPVHRCLAFTSSRTRPMVNRTSWLCLFGAVYESWRALLGALTIKRAFPRRAVPGCPPWVDLSLARFVHMRSRPRGLAWPEPVNERRRDRVRVLPPQATRL